MGDEATSQERPLTLNLSQKAIDDFKERYQTVFGERIDDAEARDRAESLMRLMAIVLRRQPWDKDDEDDVEPSSPIGFDTTR